MSHVVKSFCLCVWCNGRTFMLHLIKILTLFIYTRCLKVMPVTLGAHINCTSRNSCIKAWRIKSMPILINISVSIVFATISIRILRMIIIKVLTSANSRLLYFGCVTICRSRISNVAFDHTVFPFDSQCKHRAYLRARYSSDFWRRIARDFRRACKRHKCAMSRYRLCFGENREVHKCGRNPWRSVNRDHCRSKWTRHLDKFGQPHNSHNSAWKMSVFTEWRVRVNVMVAICIQDAKASMETRYSSAVWE
jgi:hypothetical protein